MSLIQSHRYQAIRNSIRHFLKILPARAIRVPGSNLHNSSSMISSSSMRHPLAGSAAESETVFSLPRTRCSSRRSRKADSTSTPSQTARCRRISYPTCQSSPSPATQLTNTEKILCLHNPLPMTIARTRNTCHRQERASSGRSPSTILPSPPTTSTRLGSHTPNHPPLSSQMLSLTLCRLRRPTTETASCKCIP